MKEADMLAGHADRETVIERLRQAAGDGYLDKDRLDRRVELADSAVTRSELARLTEDLPQPPQRKPWDLALLYLTWILASLAVVVLGATLSFSPGPIGRGAALENAAIICAGVASAVTGVVAASRKYNW